MYISAMRTVLACLSALTLAHSFITYDALGDSYPTGNGAGDPTHIGCGMFSGAYPGQVAKRMTLAFRNLACAGSFISTVLATQAPWVGETDIVSVQVGGNEADFFSLLNECVYQWWPLSTCDREVAKAKNIIESSSFIGKYDHLVSELKSRIKADAVLMVLGYSRFFNETTTQCDRVSFSKTNPQAFLSREKRRSFNEILSLLNIVIKGAAEAHGALYVDVDKVFEGHRFCEEEAREPSDSASWFFSDSKSDSAGMSHTDQAQIASSDSSNGFLDLTRTFHPTTRGHSAIADEMVSVLRSLNRSASSAD